MSRFRTELRRALAGIALTGLALTALPAIAGGGGLPAPLALFDAEYRVTNGSIRLGTTRISLEQKGAGWRYRSVTEADGLVSLLVSGQAVDSTDLVAHGDWLRPTRYRHTEPDDEDNVAVDFDWSRKKATVRDADGSRTLALKSDTVDGFSATLALIRRLARGEKDIRIHTIDDRGEAERLVFRHAGRERIDVPYGTFDTLRVDRVRKGKGKDRETITWLAPELDWVAVRIDQREDGDLTGRLELTDLQGVAAEDHDGRTARRSEASREPRKPHEYR